VSCLLQLAHGELCVADHVHCMPVNYLQYRKNASVTKSCSVCREVYEGHKGGGGVTETSLYKELENLLIQWFQQMRSDVPITGPILQDKPPKLLRMRAEHFKDSNGWLD